MPAAYADSWCDQVEVTASLFAKVVDPDELKRLLTGVMEPKVSCVKSVPAVMS